jgi:hypothetical protein
VLLDCEKLQYVLGAIPDEKAMAEFLRKEVWADVGHATGAKTKDLAALKKFAPRSKGATKELRKAVRAYSKLAALKPF